MIGRDLRSRHADAADGDGMSPGARAPTTGRTMSGHPVRPADQIPPDDTAEARRRFEQTAARPAPGLLAEFVAFLRANKKWWLLPILVVLLLMGLLIALTGTAAAPFIYPFF